MRGEPLECCYINEQDVYTRVRCTEIDRSVVGQQNQSLAEAMDKGQILFVNKAGEAVAHCPPDRLSWVRQVAKRR